MTAVRAVVTGASSGIGRETSRLLAEAGCHVILPGRRSDLLGKLAAECRKTGVVAEAVVADLTSETGIQSTLEKLSSLGEVGLPALINCAGSARFGGFDERPVDDVLDQIEINLVASIRLTHALIPLMLRAGGGHVVNVLSIAATHPFSGAAGYCASKAGLHMFGKALAAEYRSRGIRVTSLLPGSTDTPLWDDQDFCPSRNDMLSATAVAECIRDVVLSPRDRSFDEIVLMPPKGIL